MSFEVEKYATCIKKLRTPYPSECLEGFLEGLLERFSRNMAVLKTKFDGEKEVSLVPSKRKINLLDLSEMFHSLLKYHDPDSDIRFLYNRYLMILVDSFKPKARKYDAVFEREESFVSLEERMKKTWTVYIFSNDDEANILISILKDDIRDDYRVAKISLLKANEWKGSLPKIEIEIRGDQTEFYLFMKKLHPIVVHLKPSKEKKTVSRAIAWPLYENGLVYVSQGGQEVSEYKERLEKRAVDVLFDGKDHYKFYGTVDPYVWIEDYAKVREKIVKVGERRKSRELELELLPPASFNSLFFALNLPLDLALNVLMGKEVLPEEKYTWGISPQGGEVIFVMRSNFYKNYQKPSFFSRRERVSASEAEKEMKVQASLFNYSPFTQEKCDEALGHVPWCSVELKIPDVSVYDVEAVLVPSFLKSSTFTWRGKTVEKILRDATENLFVEYHVNPFKNRVYFYGKGVPYLYIRDIKVYRDLYDHLGKDFGFEDFDRYVAESEGLKEKLVETDLAIDHKNFVDAQSTYMNILLYKGMTDMINHQETYVNSF